MLNESARSFSWLSSLLGIGHPTSPGDAERLWFQTAKEMLDRTQVIMYSQDWLSDFWLARGTKFAGLLGPVWNPPVFIDDWQIGGQAIASASNQPSRSTNHPAFLKTLEDNASPEVSYDADALSDFTQWQSEIKQHKDTRMIQVENVRAWLGTSVGHLLMSVLLSPADPSMVPAIVNRIRLPLRFELPTAWVNDFEERRLEILYNWRITPEGQIQQSVIRVGQGEEWREHWAWLSYELGAPEVLESVQLAARLMRCPPLSNTLAACLTSGDQYLQTVSLAILRRWLLTLKVMSWLETALTHHWKDTRPQDLSCFAFNAVKPEWPRRLLAISHRSADVKLTLVQMKLWNSPYCAIDANYVPSWETNAGMMWGLFAAPLAIARIESPLYKDSVWCRRELEITDYLVDHSDFLPERSVIDVPYASLRDLDNVSSAWEQPTETNQPVGVLNSFPPLCTVWSPQPMPEWQVKLFRAAAALRVINVFFSDPSLTNSVADSIYSGMEFPGPAPTNNPDGWHSYAAIFRDLRSIIDSDSQKSPIHLPSTYSPEDMAKDRELANRIPDLSTGAYALPDVLVAFEWLRTQWPIMVEQRRGDFIVLNCQQLTKELWSSAVEVSLQRGLSSVRATGPLWFLQSAGQEVETWPLVGDRPIFTQHVRDQFGWLMELFPEEQASQSQYPADSGLDLSPELTELCKRGSTPQQ
jgi:hypothetical protein